MMRLILSAALFAACAFAATTNYVVQISADGAETIPPNTIATPAQVGSLTAEAGATLAVATNIADRAAMCADAVRLYSTNYVVTSTVYVQSIGGVPYDPSNQTIRVHSAQLTGESVVLVATVRQTPLVPPALDWRATLGAGGAWSKLTATVAETDIPAGVTDAAKAYQFTLSRPAGPSAFFRVIDNSTGASGSGLWWVVFGGIAVDGQMGRTGMVGEHRFVGGILVEPEPLGGL